MKKIIIIIIAIVFIGSGSFYGGMKYGTNKATTNIQNMRQVRGQQFVSGGAGGPRSGQGSGEGFTAGEIISKDDKSITIKLRDGGSKIIFLTTTTPVTKSATGSMEDLSAGTQVVITGKANPDGSLSAESIQIRPLLPSNSN